MASPALGVTGKDSPVNADWSISMGSPSSKRASAGTISPRRTRITSPGTSSLAAGVTHLPSRFTFALIANFALRAAIALPAWCSSQNPTTALDTNKSEIMKKSSQCLTNADKITAPSIIHGIGPQK